MAANDPGKVKSPSQRKPTHASLPACPFPTLPAVCFLCSSNRSAELMEELAESLSSRALVSY